MAVAKDLGGPKEAKLPSTPPARGVPIFIFLIL